MRLIEVWTENQIERLFPEDTLENQLFQVLFFYIETVVTVRTVSVEIGSVLQVFSDLSGHDYND